MAESVTSMQDLVSLEGLQRLGQIVRLQVHASSPKQGTRPHRWYDPSPIMTLPALRLEPGGVVGLDGDTEYDDSHHMLHAKSDFRADRGISIGLTGHYARMRERFGDFLTDGIAAENILVDADRLLAADDVRQGVLIATADGLVELTEVVVALPCVEFSRFCAGYPLERASDRGITETLQFLNDGMRGFYATLGDDEVHPVISIGDIVYLRS
jgi:hypothetical protein